MLIEPRGQPWRSATSGDVEVWVAGHLEGDDPGRLAARLAGMAKLDAAVAASLVAGLDGQFGLVARAPGWSLGAVDRIRSWPVLVAAQDTGDVLAVDARALPPMSPDDVDQDGALAVGMCGYTFGDRTVDRRIRQLRPGEVAVVQRNGRAVIHRYWSYRPWEAVDAAEPLLRRELLEVTRRVFERLVASIGDRPVVVPLSGGLDSRLVVTGLLEVGHRAVRCFAYGQPGNHEARASREIAQQLGLPWTFVPMTRRSQRHHYRSPLHLDYLAFADSLGAVPFEQDLPVVARLRDSGWIPDDAVVVNGNSGDFISGAHVPGALVEVAAATPPERRERVAAALLEKHARLWRTLATPEHDERLARLLEHEWEQLGVLFDERTADHGVFEAAEFQDRQCKYVVNGQRVYDYLGLDWRLPLWDLPYLEFWQGVPGEAKLGQRLYREALTEADWGGVWRRPHDRYVRPRWIPPVAKATRALHRLRPTVPWQEFERRWFAYWTDPLNNMAGATTWRAAVSDRRGQRHAVSWLAETYLAAKGLSIDGTPLPAARFDRR